MLLRPPSWDDDERNGGGRLSKTVSCALGAAADILTETNMTSAYEFHTQ